MKCYKVYTLNNGDIAKEKRVVISDYFNKKSSIYCGKLITALYDTPTDNNMPNGFISIIQNAISNRNAENINIVCPFLIMDKLAHSTKKHPVKDICYINSISGVAFGKDYYTAFYLGDTNVARYRNGLLTILSTNPIYPTINGIYTEAFKRNTLFYHGTAEKQDIFIISNKDSFIIIKVI